MNNEQKYLVSIVVSASLTLFIVFYLFCGLFGIAQGLSEVSQFSCAPTTRLGYVVYPTYYPACKLGRWLIQPIGRE